MKIKKMNVNEIDINAIKSGYAKVGCANIIFDRYYTKDEKNRNVKLANSMTEEKWSEHCEIASYKIHEQMRKIFPAIEKYGIKNIEDNKNDAKYYVYHNEYWNNQPYYDYVTISAWKNKDCLKDCLEIVKAVKNLDIKNVSCTIQYTTIYDEEKINENFNKICRNFYNSKKWVSYGFMTGKN